MTENKQDKASTSDNVQYVNPFGVDYCDYWALLCSGADRANELANSKLDAMVALMSGEQNGTVIHDCSPECAATHATVSVEIIPDNPRPTPHAT